MRSSLVSQPRPVTQPTIWGLRPQVVHDCYWAAHGVQVVRQGSREELSTRAALFLLSAPEWLVHFDLGRVAPACRRKRHRLVHLTLWEPQRDGYRESVTVDDDGRLLRFQRNYAGLDWRSAVVGLTREAEVARAWQEASDAESGWARLRGDIHSRQCIEISHSGSVFDGNEPADLARCVTTLVRVWQQPGTVVDRAQRVSSSVWADRDASVDPEARFGGAVWIGAGRRVSRDDNVSGPTVLWDEPTARPQGGPPAWDRIQGRRRPATTSPRAATEAPPRRRPGQRLFDIAFALLLLLATLPLFPLILLAIWLEDGRPFFFAHRRETLRGRQFPCWKFRSMRKDAEEVKATMRTLNQVDGPQFFVKDDPRLTRVGRYLRKSKLDELPQLFNVLAGHMSMVGPRPSPYEENQYCPAWREARLSVRPGITGLWQILRTRGEGLDFQEWIKFDLEYIQNAGWRLDLWILGKTILKFLRELW
jgi:lipopolysaccharide/colanic/teichoic acid biosynthesis glycosyltransferase